MRRLLKRSLAVFLVAVFLLPIMWHQNSSTAEAATAAKTTKITNTPSFSEKTITIAGIGETHQIIINNKIAKSKYAWSSLNPTIAKVSSAGIVTSVAGGTATIKCKITYPSKKSKTLIGKVVVTVPATDIKISDLTLKNNAYQMNVGDSVDLNAIITPANSTDKAYWYIDQDNILSDKDCITLDGNNEGIVKGVKAGKAVVRVKAAVNATDTSDIDDSIIIEVIAPSARVNTSEITGSNQITVTFDSPVQQSTVINTDGTLSPNISIALGKDTKKVVAADPGKLTASLSPDMKTLTITSANNLEGNYWIKFTNKILTTNGVALEEYDKLMTYTDTVAPYITNVTPDDSGMILTINFNETINFSNFAVKGASVVNSTSVTSTTLSILSNTNNYIISNDKKSVYIDLRNISSSDYGKLFCITMAGIKDLSGNAPTGYTLQAYLQTDSSARPQAQLLSLVRTGYNTLTATFDRGIKTAGFIQVNGGGQIIGVVNASNTKQVNFNISGYETFTGMKQVSIGFWSGYNVSATDTSSSKMITWNVDFTVENTTPNIATFDFDPTTNILTLNFSKEVTVAAQTGVFTATLTTQTDDIVGGVNINYAVISHTLGNNVVKLKLTFSTPKTGYFTFNIPQGFAYDNYRNMSAMKPMVFTNSNGSVELPGPYMIMQSTSDLTTIALTFANKLDIESATNINNYSIPGVQILSATLKNNTSETGAIVELKVKNIDATVDRPITIMGVKGYNNSYAAISNYTTSVLLKENTAPYYIDPPIYDKSLNVVKLNFSEQIQGSMTVSVTQISNNMTMLLSNSISVSGNSVLINLGTIPLNGAYLKIDVTNNKITDLAGNAAVFPYTTLGVLASY